MRKRSWTLSLVRLWHVVSRGLTAHLLYGSVRYVVRLCSAVSITFYVFPVSITFYMLKYDDWFVILLRIVTSFLHRFPDMTV